MFRKPTHLIVALPLCAASALAQQQAPQWADLDGDGLDELVARTPGQPDVVLRNLGDGTFAEATRELGLAGCVSRAVVLQDVDGDGRVEVLCVAETGTLRLHRSSAPGAFEDVSVDAGLAEVGDATSARWLDYDRDERLDLLVETASGTARLFHGLEGLLFEPVHLELPATLDAPVPPVGHAAQPEATAAPTSSTPSAPPASRGKNGKLGRRRPVLPPDVSLPGVLPVRGPSPSVKEVERLPGPSMCSTSLEDQSGQSGCVQASSLPTLGMLYPLSSDFFVDAASGYVGIGTTQPTSELHVLGNLRVQGEVLAGQFLLVQGTLAAVGGGSNHAVFADEACTISGGFGNVVGLDDGTPAGEYSTVGGGKFNDAQATSATISGGFSNSAHGESSAIGGGVGNRTPEKFSTVAGGDRNWAQEQASAVGGGTLNRAEGSNSTVAGGSQNQAKGPFSTVAGGASNEVSDTARSGTVGGGAGNLASAVLTTVGGGNANTASGTWATVAGGNSNLAQGVASTVGGGNDNDSLGQDAVVSGGRSNLAGGISSTVSGGTDNTASGFSATVAGGNTNDAGGSSSTISGGTFNQANASGATVAGGTSNQATGVLSAVGGGELNVGSGLQSTVGGGRLNVASGDSSTVSGGLDNQALATRATVGGGLTNAAQGAYSAVGGGSFNTASGEHSTIPGGNSNYATGAFSFAAGEGASAQHDGTFVWSGAQGLFQSTGPEQFLVDAPGGIGLNTRSPRAALHLLSASLGAIPMGPSSSRGILVEDTDATLTLASSDGGIVGSVVSMMEFSTNGEYHDQWAMYRGTTGAGSNLRFTHGVNTNWASNALVLNLSSNGNVGIGTGSPAERLDVAGNVRAFSVIETSDARLKEDVRELDGALETVRALRGVSFAWDREQLPAAEPGRQLGFLAQEVREVLPEAVREDETGRLAVAYTKLVPVLVEALKEQDARLTAQERELERLRRRVEGR